MTMTRILPLFLTMALVAGIAHAADRMPPQTRQAMHKAQVQADDGKFAEAASVLREHMATTDEKIPPQVYLMLGGVLYKGGNKKQALATFQKGMKAYPGNVQLVRNNAVISYEQEHYADAGRLFEKTYSLMSPPDPILLYQAGSAYYAGEKFAASVNALERLLAVAKAPKEAWVRLAVHACLAARQLAKAETMLRKYLAVNPEQDPYWELLAKLHLDREQFAKAAAALEICYRLRTPSQKDLERLASIYRYMNAPLMASTTLKRAYANGPDPTQRVKIANLSAAAGRTDEAVKELSQTAASAPLAETKGCILYQARRFKEAEISFAQALKHNPSAAQSRFYLAMCAWEKRDWKTAKSNLLKLSRDKKFSRRIKAPLAVIEDIETARREALE